MKVAYDKSHPLTILGDNVTTPILDTDKAKGDIIRTKYVILKKYSSGTSDFIKHRLFK